MATTRTRVYVAIAALVGAIIGALSMAPIGSVSVDGGPGCQVCGEWTTNVFGMRFADPYPIWEAILAAMIGAVVLALVMFYVRKPFDRQHLRNQLPGDPG